MQVNFPPQVPPVMRVKFKARSGRKGGITEMGICGKLTIFDGCQLSGHSTGTCVDNYYDKTNPANGLRAMKARVGYHNVDSPVVIPSKSRRIW